MAVGPIAPPLHLIWIGPIDLPGAAVVVERTPTTQLGEDVLMIATGMAMDHEPAIAIA
jgi:hypothetical protein